MSQVLENSSDAALFFSPSAVNNLVSLIGKESLAALQSKIAIVAVGPVTTAALRNQGVTRIITAADTTPAAILAALEWHFANASANQSTAGAQEG